MNNKLDSKGLTEKEYLESYNINRFEQPSLTVDMLLLTIDSKKVQNVRKLPTKSLRVLLIKRNEHPYIGQWALPGGFVRIDENIEEAAYRELEEETAIKNVYLKQLGTYGDVNRDPRGRIVSIAYMSLTNINEVKMKAGTDAADVKWFEVNYDIEKEERVKTENGFVENKYTTLKLINQEVILNAVIKTSRNVVGKHVSYSSSIESNDALSFDHAKIIQQGIERLRNKIEHSDIIFHLMPDLFTLTDLQKAYEVILDKKLLKANFRRKTSKFVSETKHSTADAGHRPSKLYKFNTMWNK